MYTFINIQGYIMQYLVLFYYTIYIKYFVLPKL